MLLFFHSILILPCEYFFLGLTILERFSLFHIGGKKYDVNVRLLLCKIYGVVYGQPNDFKLHKRIICTNNPAAIPKNPAKYAKKMYMNLHNLTVKLNEKSGILNEQIAVIDIIIIKTGLTKFALTAASPSIIPPTIPIVGPIGDGTLIPASRINSNETSINKISNIVGNGTVSRAASMVKSNSVGNSS